MGKKTEAFLGGAASSSKYWLPALIWGTLLVIAYFICVTLFNDITNPANAPDAVKTSTDTVSAADSNQTWFTYWTEAAVTSKNGIEQTNAFDDISYISSFLWDKITGTGND